MPAAAERLKIIIMGRMIAERDAEIEELRPKDEVPQNGKYDPEQVTVSE